MTWVQWTGLMLLAGVGASALVIGMLGVGARKPEPDPDCGCRCPECEHARWMIRARITAALDASAARHPSNQNGAK